MIGRRSINTCMIDGLDWLFEIYEKLLNFYDYFDIYFVYQLHLNDFISYEQYR